MSGDNRLPNRFIVCITERDKQRGHTFPKRQSVMLLFLGLLIHAAPSNLFGQPSSREDKNVIVVELFTRSDSHYAQQAEEFIKNLTQSRPGIQVKLHDVGQFEESLHRLERLSHREARVPSVYVAGKLIVGLEKIKKIEELLKIRFYSRNGCERCERASEFLENLQRRWPGIAITRFDVDSSGAARRRVDSLGRGQLPGFEIGHSVIGYYYISGFNKDKAKLIEQIFRDRSDN